MVQATQAGQGQRGAILDAEPQARVLVVEDEPLARAAIARVLRRASFEVQEAADGRTGLDEARRLQPDLVLLDARLGDLDGVDVCRRLKSDPQTALTPVVMLSGLGELDDRVRGLAAGADDYFAKPVASAELVARARHAVRVKQMTDELEAAEVMLLAMARTIEGRDPETEGHCERLSDLADRLAARLGLTVEDRVALRRAGIVHDIGKVAVPDAILLKRAPLTGDEWAVMRQHPEVGERIVAPLRSFRRVAPIVRHHHERYDGSGYPDGLAGEAIPLTARVLQVVDVYDALTSTRPYKPALAPADALAVMAAEVERGWWDPMVFQAFRGLAADAAAN